MSIYGPSQIGRGIYGTGYAQAPAAVRVAKGIYGRTMPQTPPTPYLTEDEQPTQPQPAADDPSLLRAAGDATLGGLSMFGNALDLPGSMVRDVLTWLPGGIAARNPLDQLLSPFSDKNRTTGEEILQNAGLYDDGQNDGMLASTGKFVGSVGLEIALDPLTYLTGGILPALSKSGKLAKGAGLSDDIVKAAKASGLSDDAVKAAAEKVGTPFDELGKRRASQVLTPRDLATYFDETSDAYKFAPDTGKAVLSDDYTRQVIQDYNHVYLDDIVKGNIPRAKTLDDIAPDFLADVSKPSTEGVDNLIKKYNGSIAKQLAKEAAENADNPNFVSKLRATTVDDIPKELLDGAIGANWRIKLPFMDEKMIDDLSLFGKTIKGDKIAEAGDKVAEAVRYSKFSPVSWIAPVFSKAAMNMKSAKGVKAGLALSRTANKMSQLARDHVLPHLTTIDETKVLKDFEPTIRATDEMLEAVRTDGVPNKVPNGLKIIGKELGVRHTNEMTPTAYVDAIRRKRDELVALGANKAVVSRYGNPLPRDVANANAMWDKLEGVTDDMPLHGVDNETRNKIELSVADMRAKDDYMAEHYIESGSNFEPMNLLGIKKKVEIKPAQYAKVEVSPGKFQQVQVSPAEFKQVDIVTPFKHFTRIRQNIGGRLRRAISGARRMPTKGQFAIKRDDALRHLPTSTINEMSVDKDFAGYFDKGVMGKKKPIRDYHTGTPDTGVMGSTPVEPMTRDQLKEAFFKKYDPINRPDGGTWLNPEDLTPEVIREVKKRHEALFNWIVDLDRAQVEKGVPAFDINPANSLLSSLESGYMTMASTRAARKLVSSNATRRTGNATFHMGRNYDRVRDEAINTFGSEAEQYLPVMQDRARQWAKEQGRSADEYFDGKTIGNRGDMASETAASILADMPGPLRKRAESVLGVENGNWTPEAEVAFTQSFARYSGLADENTSKWQQVYNSIKDRTTGPQKTMNQLFDSALGRDAAGQKKPFNIGSQLAKMGMDYDAGKIALIKELGDAAEQATEELTVTKKDNALNKLIELVSNDLGDTSGEVENIIRNNIDDVDAIRADIQQLGSKKKIKEANDLLDDYMTPPSMDEVLGQFEIDGELGADLARVNKAFAAPEEVNAMTDAWDALTNLFKGNVTAPFPSFHTRNVMSAFVQNALNDITDPRFSGWKKHFQHYADATQMIKGKSIEGAHEIPMFHNLLDTWKQDMQIDVTTKLSAEDIAKLDERATREIRQLIFSRKLVDSPGDHADIIGNLGGNVLDQLVGNKTFAEKVAVPDGATFLDRINPLKTKGVGSSSDEFAPVRWGRAVGEQSEQLVRSAPFIALLRQGVDADEAAKIVNRLQVNYSDLTQVERKVLRRAIPFYSFQKGATKYLASELAANPGGKVAMTIKAAENASGNDPGTPEYIRNGLNVPMGTNEDGSRHYLTGAGLMHEPPMQLLGPSLADTLFNGASMLHPAIKAPIELLTNESLFMEGPGGGGRSLDDLDPLLGRTLSNVGNSLGLTDRKAAYRMPFSKYTELMIANSPAARYLHQIRKATDPRKNIFQKGLDGLTGMRFATVDPDDRDAVLREQLEDLMRGMGGRTFSQAYMPDNTMASLSDEELEQVLAIKELLKAINNRRRKAND